MTQIALPILLAAGVLTAYTFLGYPALLKLLRPFNGTRPVPRAAPEEWPEISITVPMYNEEAQAVELLESLLELDYPVERRQILIVSDASSDRTDEIVQSYGDRGVELLRQPERAGKTAAENAAARHLSGRIVVNTDASIRIRPNALKPLIAAFSDPEIGLASGRDVSISKAHEDANVGESGYVGYEMWVRELETALSGIVGASGCFYAIRKELHRLQIPEALSRDFAAALNTREHGFRAVSVTEAVCYVPRTSSLRREYRRKVRTITRGMGTLYHKRSLLNPFRYGLFSWMLVSHKLCRWALPWAAAAATCALVLLATTSIWARWSTMFLGLALLVGGVGWMLPEARRMSKLVEITTYLLVANVAVMHATIRTLRGARDSLWEPTRRERPAPSAG